VVEEDDSIPPRLLGELSQPTDNSLGRLLTLSDGIFAIAMTLLALDLQVPDVGSHPTDRALRHALAANSNSYWAFLLTFYVIARYWTRHRRLMRSVTTAHPILIRDTLMLLLLVAVMPFPASLLGRYGGEPISLAVYGGVNALATATIILMRRDVERLHLSTGPPSTEDVWDNRWQSWLYLIVFIVCIPSGYIIGSNGPYVLLLLAVPNRQAWSTRLRRRPHRQIDQR
jgi:uncharacterized membrane protein